MEEKNKDVIVNIDNSNNKEKEQNVLTGFILSIIGVCLWFVILMMWLLTFSILTFNYRMLNLVMSIIWFLGCTTGFVFGIVVLARLRYSDGITTNPYKAFRIVSKILSIISIVVNANLMLVSFIVTTGAITNINNI